MGALDLRGGVWGYPFCSTYLEGLKGGHLEGLKGVLLRVPLTTWAASSGVIMAPNTLYGEVPSYYHVPNTMV